MKKLIVILPFLLLLFSIKAQPATGNYKEYIGWKDSVKLTWNDFKAAPINNAAEAAMTASSMEFSYKTKNNQLFWNVNVKFFPLLSWSNKSKQSDYILKHEQLHFDITELYARLFRKQLTESVSSIKDIPKLKSINKKILQEWQAEQNKYDRETNHSINEAKQLEWNKNIQLRLDALKAFASK
jgi:hypothetical protein